MSLEDALITCLLHSSKEQWIILLVYWADSHYQKMSFYAAWTGQSVKGRPKQQKQTFLKLRSGSVNKKNNPLFFTAMT